MNRQGRPGEVRCPECRGELPTAPAAATALLESGCVYCGTELGSEILPIA